MINTFEDNNFDSVLGRKDSTTKSQKYIDQAASQKSFLSYDKQARAQDRL